MFCESNTMQFYTIFKIKACYRIMRVISKPAPLNAPIDDCDHSKHPCAMSGKSTRVPIPRTVLAHGQRQAITHTPVTSRGRCHSSSVGTHTAGVTRLVRFRRRVCTGQTLPSHANLCRYSGKILTDMNSQHVLHDQRVDRLSCREF